MAYWENSVFLWAHKKLSIALVQYYPKKCKLVKVWRVSGQKTTFLAIFAIVLYRTALEKSYQTKYTVHYFDIVCLLLNFLYQMAYCLQMTRMKNWNRIKSELDRTKSVNQPRCHLLRHDCGGGEGLMERVLSVLRGHIRAAGLRIDFCYWPLAWLLVQQRHLTLHSHNLTQYQLSIRH